MGSPTRNTPRPFSASGVRAPRYELYMFSYQMIRDRGTSYMYGTQCGKARIGVYKMSIATVCVSMSRTAGQTGPFSSTVRDLALGIAFKELACDFGPNSL